MPPPTAPPHPTMRNSKLVTDPLVRNMMIPLWRFADGISCRSKRFGVHELRVKVGSCFREDCAKTPQAHCPHLFTNSRPTCLPSRLALAGSYPKVPEVRSNWLTKGGRWSQTLIIPRLDRVLASQPELPSTR